MPVVGVLVALVLLPVAALPFVPAGPREVLSYLVVWLPFGAAIVVSVRLAVKHRREAWWRALRLPLGATGIALGLFAGLAARSIGVLLEVLTTGRIGTGSVLPGGAAAEPIVIVAVVVASVLIAPVVEELLFRGTLQPAVGERLGAGPWGGGLAVVIVAAVFAAVHAAAGATLLATVVTFVAGIAFGLVARSQGVGSAVVAHVVFNASGLALSLSGGGLSPVYPTLSLG